MSRDMLHVTHNTSHVTQRGWWTLSQNFRLVAPTVWEKLCFKYLEWNAVIPLTHSPKVASLSKEELRATTQGGRQGAEKEVLYSIVLSVCIKLRSRILGSSEITKTNEVNLHSFCFDSFLKWLKFVKFSIKFLTLIAEEKCKYNRLYNCEFYCVWLGLCGVRPSALRLSIAKIGSHFGTVQHCGFDILPPCHTADFAMREYLHNFIHEWRQKFHKLTFTPMDNPALWDSTVGGEIGLVFHRMVFVILDLNCLPGTVSYRGRWSWLII